MVVDDGDGRQEKCEPVAVNSAREVYVFRVHEVSFIKQPCLQYGFRTQEHKASAEVRYIHRSVVTGIPQFVAIVAPSGKAFGQETSCEHVERCRQQFGKVLCFAVRVQHFRHDLSDFGMCFHICVKVVYIRCLDDDIVIHNQMVCRVIIHGFADGDIVCLAIAEIGVIEDILDVPVKSL